MPVETQTRARFRVFRERIPAFPANFSVFIKSQLELSRWPGSETVGSFGKKAPRDRPLSANCSGRPMRAEAAAIVQARARFAATLFHESPVVSTFEGFHVPS